MASSEQWGALNAQIQQLQQALLSEQQKRKELAEQIKRNPQQDMAALTASLREVLDRPKDDRSIVTGLPRGLKVPELPKYDGAPLKAREWANEVKRWKTNVPDWPGIISYVSRFLTGTAKSWADEQDRVGTQFEDLEAWLVALVEYHRAPREGDDRFGKFLEHVGLKMHGSRPPVREYIAGFRDHVLNFPDPYLTDSSSLFFFMLGLRPNIRKALAHDYPTSLEEAYARAEIMAAQFGQADSMGFVPRSSQYQSTSGSGGMAKAGSNSAKTDGPTPMDLNAVINSNGSGGSPTCYKCGKKGHISRQCTAVGDAILPSWKKKMGN